MTTEMSIITLQETLDDVPDAWKHQYEGNRYGDKSKITKELNALKPEELTKEKIDKIIGNTGWTSLACCVCGEEVDKVVRFHDEYAEDFCESCLEDGLKQLRETKT